MANLREIKKRISSVTSTKQITRTMEMVSTAKIRRALDRAYGAEPYKTALTDVMLTVAQDAEAAGDAPLLKRHDEHKRALVVAIASDRGHAGEGIECEVVTCGRKVSEYFASRADVVMSFAGESADPTLDQARMIASYICEGYVGGHLDRVDLVYHHARNRVDQELRHEVLLPLDTDMNALARGPRRNEGDAPQRVSSSFAFVPSAREVLDGLVPSYVLTVIYQALIDSAAAEQGARRKAMHSATENATAIIATLTRTYNRVRQASITTEINEIVGGAAALEE